MSRRNFLQSAGVGAAAIGAAAMGFGGVAHAATKPIGPLLHAAVQAVTIPGMFDWNPNGTQPPDAYNPKVPTGLEADIVRAVFMAKYGDYVDGRYLVSTAMAANFIEQQGMISWIPSTSTTRWYHLFGFSGYEKADIMVRACTNTLTRDMYQKDYGYGCTFAPTYYHDGTEVLLKGDGPYTVAVAIGTTTEKVVDEWAEKEGWGVVKTADSDIALNMFKNGDVNGVGNDSSAIAYLAIGDAYLFFTDKFGGPYGKEPLAPATEEGDDRWSDIARWAIFVLIQAEEMNVTSANVTTLFGAGLAADLGLAKNWAYKVIKAVGNYGEISYRWFGARPGTRGKNDLWENGGAMTAPAFR